MQEAHIGQMTAGGRGLYVSICSSMQGYCEDGSGGAGRRGSLADLKLCGSLKLPDLWRGGGNVCIACRVYCSPVARNSHNAFPLQFQDLEAGFCSFLFPA